MRDINEIMKQIETIQNGNGIQYILDESCKILGNPILIHDMDYRVIAHTENTVTDDPIWNESEKTGMVSYSRLLFLRDKCCSERAADEQNIIFLLSDELKYDRLFGKIFTTNNIQVGYACMVACYKPFDDDCPKLFKTVCDILNKELCQSKFYQEYGQTYLETLVSQLIEENLENTDLISHVESIYMGLKGILRLSVVDISRADPALSKLAYFRDIFKQIRPDFKYAVYKNHIVGLSSSDYNALDVEAVMKLYMVFEQNNLYAGISDYFENIYELSKYYHQAADALTDGLNNTSDQRIFIYEKN